jgi:8-oxo-dGTP pyrophosphatase MutT (NUDIX family)
MTNEPGQNRPAVRDDLLSDLESFLRRRLAEPLPGPAAQRRFATTPPQPEWAPDLTPETARRAAALLLLYPTTEGMMLPLTVRQAGLPHHGGQVSLPGGAQDPGESSIDTALREAHEEIGVAAGHVRLVGQLSTLWIPVSNFVLTPIVGVADRRPDFRPHAGEVADLLELPLAHLRDSRHIQWGRRSRRGLQIDYPYVAFEGHHIWGATAMILSEFVCLFDAAGTPPSHE